MKLIDLTCSKCGAQLKVNSDLKKCMCQFCGNEMLIDDEVLHHKIDNAFQAGYEAELGRQKALSDIAIQKQQQAQQQQQLAQQKLLEQQKMFAERQAKLAAERKEREKYGMIAVWTAWIARLLIILSFNYDTQKVLAVIIAIAISVLAIVVLNINRGKATSTLFKVNMGFTIYFIVGAFIIAIFNSEWFINSAYV